MIIFVIRARSVGNNFTIFIISRISMDILESSGQKYMSISLNESVEYVDVDSLQKIENRSSSYLNSIVHGFFVKSVFVV